MKFLNIFGSSDPFSHEMSPILVKTGCDYSDQDLTTWCEKYSDRFQAKIYSAISIVLLNVDEQTGTVEVLENIQGRHPLKQKTVVNPSAEIVRTKRKENRGIKTVTIGPTLGGNAQEQLNGWAEIAPVNPLDDIFNQLGVQQ